MPAPKRKTPIDLKSLARSYTEAAVQTLGGIAAKGESEAARVNACAILLDRGWGKAEQIHSGGIDGDIRITIRTILEDNRAKIIEAAKLIEGDDHDKPK